MCVMLRFKVSKGGAKTPPVVSKNLGTERVGVEPTNPRQEIANYKFAGLNRCPTAPQKREELT